jgi:hypothetical protein
MAVEASGSHSVGGLEAEEVRPCLALTCSACRSLRLMFFLSTSKLLSAGVPVIFGVLTCDTMEQVRLSSVEHAIVCARGIEVISRIQGAMFLWTSFVDSMS